MLGKLREIIIEIDNPEQYFKNKLGKNSEDFLMLEKLLEELEWDITWEKLKKCTKIKNGKVEGIYWEDSLLLSYVTSLGKLKKVGGNLHMYGVSSIKDLGRVSKVGGYLDIKGTSVELQLEVMRKIKNGELVIEGNVHYDDLIKKYFAREGRLDFEMFEEKYGTRVDEIEGEQQEQIRQFLEGIKEFEKKYLEKEIVKVLKEYITQEEMKEKIEKLNNEYKVYIRMIDGYLDDKR